MKWIFHWVFAKPHLLITLGIAGSISCLVYAAVIWFCFPDVYAHLKQLLERRRREA